MMASSELAFNEERMERSMDAVVRLLGKDGTRALALRDAPRKDDGYFGPGSVSWKVWGHPHIGIAGLMGSLVAVADPVGAAGVAQHSNYRRDPLGRVKRSNAFFLAAVFGDTETAQKAGTTLFRRHAVINGVVPGQAEAYRANTPDSLLFVYVTGWHGVLQTYRRFAGELSDAEEREFYAESVITAELLGLSADLVPSTPEEVHAYLDIAKRDIMSMTDDAQELLDFYLRPPFSPVWPLAVINPFLRIATWASLDAMDPEVRQLMGNKPRPIRDAFATRAARLVMWLASTRLGDPFMVIAGPDAWGRRHNALRHSTGTGRVPYQGDRARTLQRGRGGTMPVLEGDDAAGVLPAR
jgi:uncharacterized protein (DUF2236 family)